MKEKIFKGESLTIVLRCRDRNGISVDMRGKRVYVVMVDNRNVIAFEFSTEKRNITIEGCYLLCPILYTEMKKLQGVYMAEIRVEEDVWKDSIQNGNEVVRVKESTIVQIAQIPGVRILDSITGKTF